MGTGCLAMLVWLGVRAARGVRGEVEYWRWRRRRFHRVVLPHPDGKPVAPLAVGHALVWDDGRRST